MPTSNITPKVIANIALRFFVFLLESDLQAIWILDLNPVISPPFFSLYAGIPLTNSLEKTVVLALKPSVLKIHMGAESLICCVLILEREYYSLKYRLLSEWEKDMY